MTIAGNNSIVLVPRSHIRKVIQLNCRTHEVVYFAHHVVSIVMATQCKEVSTGQDRAVL